MLVFLLNILILLIMPWWLLGLILKTKAFWSGRRGPSVWQPAYDFLKLWRKELVLSTVTTMLFRVTPALAVAAVFTAGLLVPLTCQHAIWSFEGDFIVFAYLLGSVSFLALLSALDTGGSFEGMGASREASFASMLEPPFFLVIGTIGLKANYFSLASLPLLLTQKSPLVYLLAALACGVLLIMLLIEGCRIPFDDPNTHLELTMIHEVMVLDNTGPDLACWTYQAGLKMLIFGSFIATILLPPTTCWYIWLLMYGCLITILAISIGTLESAIARLRLLHVPEMVIILTSFGLIMVAALVMLKFGGVA